ncbi:ubiquitin thioesterase otulin-like [Latimeria chalumnae]|uniref:ubiquitin thioesterase otulin-like n=1 Tax=Latimeria chalumnae TaxID=7897 RepID=UPI00313E95DA
MDSSSLLGEKTQLLFVSESFTETDGSTVLNSVKLIKNNYFELKKRLFEAMVECKQLSPWMLSVDLLQLPSMLFENGYAWINQWCFEYKTDGNPVEKLQACLDTFQTACSSVSDLERQNRIRTCKSLFENQKIEQRMLEAVKFLMLDKAIHLFNKMEDGEDVPAFCKELFARSTSRFPYHFMMNHLNLIGDTGKLEEVSLLTNGGSVN